MLTKSYWSNPIVEKVLRDLFASRIDYEHLPDPDAEFKEIKRLKRKIKRLKLEIKRLKKT